jgi:hypothetical protein
MSTAYQRDLYETKEYCTEWSCLGTTSYKLKGEKVYIHFGNYDREFIAYVCLPVSMFKEEATSRFRATLSAEGDNHLHIYSKSIKSLKATIHRNLKEQL